MIAIAQSHAPGVAVPSEGDVSAQIYMRFVAQFEPRVIRPGAESTSDAKGTECSRSGQVALRERLHEQLRARRKWQGEPANRTKTLESLT